MPVISKEELQNLLEPVISLAKEAGESILEIYDMDFTIQKKADKTPVTTADLEAHRIILRDLKDLTPDWPVLSEEAVEIPFEIRKTWNTYWLVDPLDGTREFIKRNGEFSVNIALVHHHQAVLGVVYAPVLNTVYYACRNGGAYRQFGEYEAKKIKVRKVSDDAIMIAGSRSHRNDKLGQYLHRLGQHELFSMGSSLKSCLVAEGKADLYPRLGLTSEWDTAAAQCIVEEAGGLITSTDMKVLQYNTKPSLTNPHFFVFGDKSKDWSAYL